MESQETIQRRSRLIGYAFDAAKTGQPMSLICRSVEEQNDLFARLKDLLSQQRITSSPGMDEENNLYHKLDGGEKIVLSIPPIVLEAAKASVDNFDYEKAMAASPVKPLDRILGLTETPVNAIGLAPEKFDALENDLLMKLAQLRASKVSASRDDQRAIQNVPQKDNLVMKGIETIMGAKTRTADEIAKNKSALDDLVGNSEELSLLAPVQGAVGQIQSSPRRKKT